MEIKKGYRFVCIKDVYLNGDGEHLYKKGNIYVSEHDGCITDETGNQHHIWNPTQSIVPFIDPEITEFIPYYQLDKVYTKHTPLLEKIFYKYEGKKGTDYGNVTNYCNCDSDENTGYFWGDGVGIIEYYQEQGYTYLSEQAFIEYMDLGKYIGGLNVESEGFTKKELEVVSDVIDNCIYGEEDSYSFPTDWYLNLDNPEIDINIIRDYLRGLEGINRSFITSVEGCLLGQDIMGDGSYQHWGSDKDLLENKYNLVEISYQDFLESVYRKKEVVEEVPDYLKIAEEWSKEGEKEEEVFNPKPYYDNSKGSLYKVATERGWSVYTFDVVKRLERGGKKDPLRQEIEKSIDVLKIWLNELEDDK